MAFDADDYLYDEAYKVKSVMKPVVTVILMRPESSSFAWRTRSSNSSSIGEPFHSFNRHQALTGSLN